MDERGAGSITVVLFNPKLVDMQSTGYGLVGRDLRTMVTESFATCLALKTYPDGALYRAYPGGWAVWREDGAAADGSGYTLAWTGPRRPSGDEVEELLEPDDGEPGAQGGMLDGLGAFIKGFQAL